MTSRTETILAGCAFWTHSHRSATSARMHLAIRPLDIRRVPCRYIFMSELINTGGPAFPVVAEGGTESGLNPVLDFGMTLRDYFAAHIISAIISKAEPNDIIRFGVVNAEKQMANVSYRVADAMLLARTINQTPTA